MMASKYLIFILVSLSTSVFLSAEARTFSSNNKNTFTTNNHHHHHHELKLHDNHPIVDTRTPNHKNDITHKTLSLRCGSIFAGWNPFGYKITDLGMEYLAFDGSLDSDVGRFLASVKTTRKSAKVLKEEWLSIVKVSKKAQSLRIYRKMSELIAFCLSAGFMA